MGVGENFFWGVEFWVFAGIFVFWAEFREIFEWDLCGLGFLRILAEFVILSVAKNP